GTDVGRVRVFSGKNGLPLYSLSGVSTGGQFGTCVAGRADVDGDGSNDLAAGAPSPSSVSIVAGNVQVWSVEPAGLAVYGTGTPGCAGTQKAYGNSVPSIGNAAFQLNVSKAPPSALNLGLVTDAKLQPGVDLFGLGFVWHVDPVLSQTFLVLDVISNPDGYGFAPTPIPNVASFAGAKLYFQTISVWGSICALPPLGLSSSKGLAFTLQ
ncbi:MAG TPA: integrin alpha, partial [Planctomycetota bacterium]|nr:integrin alpha [Planctomycetota bacterium]